MEVVEEMHWILFQLKVYEKNGQKMVLRERAQL